MMIDPVAVETKKPSEVGEPWMVAGLEIANLNDLSLENVIHCIETFEFSPDELMPSELDEEGHFTCKYIVWGAVRSFMFVLSFELVSSKLSFSIVQESKDEVHKQNMLSLFQSAYDKLKAVGENEMMKEWLDVVCPYWRNHLKEAKQDLTLVPE